MVFDHTSPEPSPLGQVWFPKFPLYKKCLNDFYCVGTLSKQILAPSNNNFDHQRWQCCHLNIWYEAVNQDNSFSNYNSNNNKYLSLETKQVNVLIPEDEYSIQKLFVYFLNFEFVF